MDEILLRLLDSGYEVTFARGTVFGYFADLRDSSGLIVSTYIGETPAEALAGVVRDEMRAGPT